MERTLEDWRDVLLKQLAANSFAARKPRRYFDGQQVLPPPDADTDRRKYRRLAAMSVTNFCGLIVKAPASKLTPIGVRLSETDDEDPELWREVWIKNRLNTDSRIVFREALKVGRSFMLVWPREDGGVSVTVEDVDEVAVAYEPGDHRRRVAALKVYNDGETDYCTVWTRTEVAAWQRPARRAGSSISGVWEEDPDESKWGANPLGEVPIVEFLCDPDAKGNPTPELSDDILRKQDNVNFKEFNILVAEDSGAFPQRVTIGISIRRDANGNPVNPLTFGPNRVVALESSDPDNPNAGRVDQFPAYSTSDLLEAKAAAIRELGWATRTSAIFMLGGSSNVGADMIRALDDGHKTKVLEYQANFGEQLEDVFALSLLALNREPVDDIEIDWVSPEFRSPAELADAAIKMRQAGYSFKSIARLCGASPAEVRQLVAEREAEIAAGTNADKAIAASQSSSS